MVEWLVEFLVVSVQDIKFWVLLLVQNKLDMLLYSCNFSIQKVLVGGQEFKVIFC